MCTFERDRAYEHCRTCLVKFENESLPLNELKKVEININKHASIKHLIEMFIDAQPTDALKGFPKNICKSCYNKLQAFDDFCKQAQENAQKLFELFSNNDLVKSSENVTKEIEREELETEDFWGPLNNAEFTDSSSDFSGFNSEPELIAKKSKSKKKVDSAAGTDLLATEDSPKKTIAKKIIFKCNDCSEVFESLSQLDKHLVESHFDPKRPHRCNECNKTFSVAINLERHKQDNHNGKKYRKVQDVPEINALEEFNCKECNRSFITKTSLKKHLELRHTSPNVKTDYYCKECEKTYSTKSNYDKHMRYKHTKPKTTTEDGGEIKCEYCDKVFPKRSSLSKHVSYKHPKRVQSFVCEHCGIIYPIWTSLKLHLKTKHPTEEDLAEREQKRQTFECPHCKKLYQSTYKLRDHVQEKHSDHKPLVCGVCNKRFAVQHLFRVHLKTHEVRAKIPCDICGKEISSRYELNEHIKAVHMKLRPFNCQYCEKNFACRKTLKHHTYTHTGEKPYVCNVCGVAYRQRSCLRNHKKTHETQYTNVEYLHQTDSVMEVDNQILTI